MKYLLPIMLSALLATAGPAWAREMPEYRDEKRNDFHRIHVGEECYEIPDAVIFGG